MKKLLHCTFALLFGAALVTAAETNSTPASKPETKKEEAKPALTPAPKQPAATVTEPASSSSSLRTVSYVVAGAGLAAIGVGGLLFSILSAMFAMSQQASNLEERELFQMAIEEAVTLTSSEIGYLHFVNDDQETISLYTWSQGTLQYCTAAYDSHYPVSAAGIWAAPVLTRSYHQTPDQFAGWMGLVILGSGVVGAIVGGGAVIGEGGCHHG